MCFVVVVVFAQLLSSWYLLFTWYPSYIEKRRKQIDDDELRAHNTTTTNSQHLLITNNVMWCTTSIFISAAHFSEFIWRSRQHPKHRLSLFDKKKKIMEIMISRNVNEKYYWEFIDICAARHADVEASNSHWLYGIWHSIHIGMNFVSHRRTRHHHFPVN